MVFQWEDTVDYQRTVATRGILRTVGAAIGHYNDFIAECQAAKALRQLRLLIMHANECRKPDHDNPPRSRVGTRQEVRRRANAQPPGQASSFV